MDNLASCYKMLFDHTNNTTYRCSKKELSLSDLSHFVGIEGKKYRRQNVRLLIVGRAVNGWGQFVTINAEAFAKSAMEETGEDHFNWVVFDNGNLRNNVKDKETDKYYWLSRSAFWRTNKTIWKALSGNNGFIDSAEDRWIDHIAWTNLYKIAPEDGGNPTNTMIKKQNDACVEILKAEVSFFKPTHILFVTGFDWFKSFEGICPNIMKSHKNSEDCGFVEASGISPEGVKVVVSARPERKAEENFAYAIVSAFNSL